MLPSTLRSASRFCGGRRSTGEPPLALPGPPRPDPFGLPLPEPGNPPAMVNHAPQSARGAAHATDAACEYDSRSHPIRTRRTAPESPPIEPGAPRGSAMIFYSKPATEAENPHGLGSPSAECERLHRVTSCSFIAVASISGKFEPIKRCPCASAHFGSKTHERLVRVADRVGGAFPGASFHSAGPERRRRTARFRDDAAEEELAGRDRVQERGLAVPEDAGPE